MGRCDVFCYISFISFPLNFSVGVLSNRKLHDDLCDLSETCWPNRVVRLANLAGYTRDMDMYNAPPNMTSPTLVLLGRCVLP